MRSRIESLLFYLQVLSAVVTASIIILFILIFAVQTNTTISLQVEGDVFNLLNIAATIWLGLYLAKTINKRDTETRIEKDLLISIVEKTSEQIENLQNLIEESQHSNVLLTSCVSAFHSIRQKLAQLEKTCKVCDIGNLEKSISEVRTSLMKVNRIVTGAPIVNSHIQMSATDSAEALDFATDCQSQLIELKIAINRL